MNNEEILVEPEQFPRDEVNLECDLGEKAYINVVMYVLATQVSKDE